MENGAMKHLARSKRGFRLAATSLTFLLAAALLPAGAGPTDASRLEKLRLLPPILVKGEEGYSLAERMRHYHVEAVSVAVIKDFRVLWTEARGLAEREAKEPATTSTLFQAGSISKPVAAAGVLRRVEAGELRLDRDVNEYLKSWKLPESALTAKQKVTLERILSHSAGLTVHGFPGYEAGAPVPTLPQVLDGAPPANTAPVRVDIEPGSRFRYAGGGTTIAQLVMTDTTGKPFPELMKELVLGPAGMNYSTYEQPLPDEKLRLAAAGYYVDGAAVPGKRHTYPEMAAAGLWTTSEDLARFALAIARSLRGDPGSLLSKETAARMTTPLSGEAGLGFFIQKHGADLYFGHTGSDEGFQAFLLMHRERGYGAAVMANSENGNALASEIVRGIAREDGWAGYLPEPVAIAKLPRRYLEPLSGRYQLSGDEAFTLTVRSNRLFGKPADGDEYELFPISRDLFLRKDRPTRYQIERSDGSVAGILLLAGEERIKAKRMHPGARLPSDDLADGKIDEALAAYRGLFAEKPEDPGIAEQRLNRMGYQLAARKEFAGAIAVLKLNTELRPGSSNTYDSLAEIYLLSGDRDRSLETYRQALEVLPKDTTTDPSLKEQLRKNAEVQVKKLSE
jgi:CubicO group peptidase (beta-lactamase class C family)